MNNLLPLLGLAKKAGVLELGEEPTGAAARARAARLILVACDAADNTCRRAAHFAQTGSCPWVTLPFTKAQIGSVVGRASCAVAAVTDTGLAASVAAKLAAADGAFAPLAGELGEKAKKVLQRQRQQRQHGKNLRHGVHRAPPPAPKAAPPERRGSRPGSRAGSSRRGASPHPSAPAPRRRQEKDSPSRSGGMGPQGRSGSPRDPKKAP